ncbi:TonB-dependent receptor [Flavivirga amylovorans]|uniref:TonB-dependent receptor n=1 Tax=Flavivirga amylovorans TaxID=870486 RepID=A0ABT8X0C7_9FLAO|nr:TonB-dependent receptor [Flavivirga amylovorans]MDO5987084.1 TonB-dependent receptor [Flavivirga amylovorans]
MKTKLSKTLLVFFICFSSLHLLAQQQITITGIVVDKTDKIPIAGANIIVKGTSRGTTSDFDGNYSLKVSTGDILVISYIGYTKMEKPVGTTTVINIELEQSLDALDEVVVIGYGTQKKRDVTGSVATISLEKLQEQPNSNFGQALQGAIPGAIVTLNSAGAEQGDINLLVRGRNSINAGNRPLVVLDGIIYSGNISDINVNDIKNMSVLKDASATAIYGSRGSNGVILIQSKKGKKGKPKISFNAFTAVNTLDNLPALHDGPGFAALKENREAGQLTDTEINSLLAGRETDWVELGTRTGYTQEYNLSISGATDNTNYFVSGGYHKAEGIMLNDDFERASLRANIELNISENLKFGASVLLTRLNRSGLGVNLSSTSGGILFANPLGNAFNDDGSLTINPWPEDQFFVNPLSNTLVTDEDISYKIFTSNFVEYKIPFIEGLSYRLNVGGEYRTRNRNRYYPRTTRRGLDANGEAEVITRIDDNLLIEHILNFNRTFGDHDIGFTGLYSVQRENINQSQFSATGFPSDDLTFRQFESSQSGILADDNDNFSIEENRISQMGRLNYSYKGKYLATLTVRRDGYSGFGINNKFGVFPSAALAWKISDESFFNTDGILNNLKLRLTYGEVGNEAVGAFTSLARLDVLNIVDDSDALLAGFVLDEISAPSVSWETTATTNIGLDIGLLKNKIQLNLDWYKGTTRDLLFNTLIPGINGDTNVFQNVGKTSNQGFEIGLNANIINTEDFSWNVSGSFAYNKNEVVELFGGLQQIQGGSSVLIVGQPILVNFDEKFDGIWQIGDDFANSAQKDALPGDVRLLNVVDRDINGDGIIDASDFSITPEDRVVQGQRDPTTTYGISTNLSYKNISLSISGNGLGGLTRQNNVKDVNPFDPVRRNIFVQDYWTPDNPINTFHRNAQGADNGIRFYENSSFFRVRDITLAYNIDKVLGESNSAKVYLTGRNLFTFTNFGGIDPELGVINGSISSSDAATRIPNQKQIVFGLNLNF